VTTHVVWFRRDLRVRDHPALVAACREAERVVALFVFDERLLAGRFRSAGRTAWLIDALRELDAALQQRGSRLVVRVGDPRREVPAVARDAGASVVHVTDDVTAFARRRDDAVERELGCELRRHPGLTIAEVSEVLTGQGKPYTVYSPFFRRWKAQGRRPVERAPSAVPPPPPGLAVGRVPSVEALGFPEGAPGLVDRPEPGEEAGRRAAKRWIDASLAQYAETRNTLSVDPSRLSVYLRYGCVSPLWLETQVLDQDETFRGELAWRDFYLAVQLHFPWTARLEFQERYRDLEWDADERLAEAWCAGRTGYPVVDAAMRQLHAMGWMHNRARMIVGSFLTKDLHQDWRIGEAHFMHHLLDGDVASNNGGWQWVASTGTDPAPYFQRLFNPMTQQEKFDPDGAYVRRWLPELDEVPLDRLSKPWTWPGFASLDYPEPVVDHAQARRRAIERYRAVAD
jgi:deoxyribodipyrimidine photo-lyase